MCRWLWVLPQMQAAKQGAEARRKQTKERDEQLRKAKEALVVVLKHVLEALVLACLSVAAPRGSAAEGRRVKNMRPLLPGPDHTHKNSALSSSPLSALGTWSSRRPCINDLAFCRASHLLGHHELAVGPSFAS
jgi:hypothetical protein